MVRNVAWPDVTDTSRDDRTQESQEHRLLYCIRRSIVTAVCFLPTTNCCNHGTTDWP